MKDSIRRDMRTKNLTISAIKRENYANNIFGEIERSDIFTSSRVVAIYAALPDELPTEKVIRRWSTLKTILLPRIGEGAAMEFYEYNPLEMSVGAYGIEEPQAPTPYLIEDIDLIIVPGVAFTLDGGRVGRGKGYYDRYLSRKEVHAHTIGVCYPHQVVDSLPVEPHDVPLRRVICGL